MKTLILALTTTALLAGCDTGPAQKAVYRTDEAKEERLYMACLDAVKVKVKAGEDNLEDAITSCRTNASALSSKMVYVNANPKKPQ
ncbi:hypothetical protein PHOBOS_128 [Erwinia phage vB_EamM_Phobos]|uniref:hypothetical protein n=1 Tax=Erwinia phage vB_EamM_Phobos TaxID=1883377 RepID=UPI00081C3389|nr:hypothetical protein BIZ79_gp128 [Erwinia phage vB_EamM_Phobos]ANZ50318.1 hypothetical protein PHOBOS_128 [Erwinia phage vB_EamM_Phobos]